MFDETGARVVLAKHGIHDAWGTVAPRTAAER